MSTKSVLTEVLSLLDNPDPARSIFEVKQILRKELERISSPAQCNTNYVTEACRWIDTNLPRHSDSSPIDKVNMYSDIYNARMDMYCNEEETKCELDGDLWFKGVRDLLIEHPDFYKSTKENWEEFIYSREYNSLIALPINPGLSAGQFAKSAIRSLALMTDQEEATICKKLWERQNNVPSNPIEKVHPSIKQDKSLLWSGIVQLLTEHPDLSRNAGDSVEGYFQWDHVDGSSLHIHCTSGHMTPLHVDMSVQYLSKVSNQEEKYIYGLLWVMYENK